ncbi:MAG TPA: hypothetical protein PLH94_01830 [Fimbriimonadaceae bacterium]|nr:hypothetical protein [Fimbriimonadaceae bacterium]
MSLLTAPVGEANASQDTRAGSTQSPSTKSARALSYDPNLAANYHLDRTNQEAFETALQSRFTPGQGKSWTDKPIMVQFAAPLGYRELRNSLSRNFTEQQISEIKIAVNGRTIPFIGDPKPQDSNYYTFVPEQLTGHDLLVIRLDSPGAGTANPIDVRVDLKGTWISSVPKAGAKTGGYTFDLTPKQQAVGLEMQEHGYTVDAPKLVEQLQRLGVVGERPFRVSDVLGNMARLAVTSFVYDTSNRGSTNDVNEFFARPNPSGSCQKLNTPVVLALRALGVPVTKISGRDFNGDGGHAAGYAIDPQLGDALMLDASAVAAWRPKSQGPLDLLGVGQRKFVWFELDSTLRYRFSLSFDDGPKNTADGTSNCGRMLLSQGGDYVGSAFPSVVPGTAKSWPALKPTDPRFVNFSTGVGPRFVGQGN